MQKVEIWGAVKVDHKIYRDNEILKLIGKPITHWEFLAISPMTSATFVSVSGKRNGIFLVRTDMPCRMRWTMPGSALGK